MTNRPKSDEQGGYPASDLGSYFPPGRHSAPHHHTLTSHFKGRPGARSRFKDSDAPCSPAVTFAADEGARTRRPLPGYLSASTSAWPVIIQNARVSQPHMRSTQKYGRRFDCRTPEAPPLPARSEASQEPAKRHRAHVREPNRRRGQRPEHPRAAKRVEGTAAPQRRRASSPQAPCRRRGHIHP